MFAARLHGPRDLRAERVPHPGAPSRGQVLLRVKATGICGSDLHSYLDARIGDTPIGGPLILGHEFSAVVEAVGPGSIDGHFQPLKPGTRVAVDPAQPCGHCELCDKCHPNLCCHLAVCGNYPYGGSLCERMLMPARSCFPVSRQIDDEAAALLEPTGQVYWAGVERCVEIPAVRERDILLTNMQRVAGPVMAEHVLAMMFAFARGLDFYIPERAAKR